MARGPELLHGSVPVPDPTELTTKLTEREITALREVLDEKITGNKVALETRLNEMDKAIVLVREEHQRLVETVPLSMDEKIKARAELVDEKFRSIATQFQERDIRTEQTSRDSKVAVDAALQAAKEAVNAQQIANSLSIDKSERATAKQIDQLAVTMQTSAKSTDDKIGDIKDRLTLIEGMGQGKDKQIGTWIAAAGLLIAAAVLFARVL